jgi:HNH endonuclease
MLVSPVQAHDQERPRRRRSELERLLDRTILEPTHPELGTCWRFTGTTTPYGRIAKAQDSYTHRLGWQLLRGDIPGDKELHHRCGVYACWNPDHLELVTHAENQLHLRKTHCKHGHPLSGDNLRIGPNGVRTCRACNAANPACLPRAPHPPEPLARTPHSDRYVNLPRFCRGPWCSCSPDIRAKRHEQFSGRGTAGRTASPPHTARSLAEEAVVAPER